MRTMMMPGARPPDPGKLADAVRWGLANGVRHRDRAGRHLATAEAVLAALRDERQVTYDVPEEVER